MRLDFVLQIVISISTHIKHSFAALNGQVGQKALEWRCFVDDGKILARLTLCEEIYTAGGHGIHQQLVKQSGRVLGNELVQLQTHPTLGKAQVLAAVAVGRVVDVGQAQLDQVLVASFAVPNTFQRQSVEL